MSKEPKTFQISFSKKFIATFAKAQFDSINDEWNTTMIESNRTFYSIGVENDQFNKTTLNDDDFVDTFDVTSDDEEALDGRALKQMIQSVTKIDVGPQSQLFIAPGSTSVIYFEVTNLRNEPTYYTFNVQDEKRFLRQMEPRL